MPLSRSTRPSRDEDHFAARAIWRLAHLVNKVARGTQRSRHLVLMAKAQRCCRRFSTKRDCRAHAVADRLNGLTSRPARVIVG
jgi:hypothetical protein